MAKIKDETLTLNIVVNGDKARKAILDQTAAIKKKFPRNKPA